MMMMARISIRHNAHLLHSKHTHRAREYKHTHTQTRVLYVHPSTHARSHPGHSATAVNDPRSYTAFTA